MAAAAPSTRSFGNGVKLVWGCESFGPGFGQGLDAADSAAALRALAAFGTLELDTARIYGDGEAEGALGHALRDTAPASGHLFDIATKAHPKFSLDHDALLEQVSTSLGALGVPSVGILYLHSPDQDAPLEGALAAVDELHRQGKIREFGLSNFSAWQTVQVYYKCKELGYVLPTVYQGVFSAKLIIENCRGFAFANRSK
jgi:aflatoxin B1 aldehyde reductase